MNWLDRAILAVAPGAGLQRVRARKIAELLQRGPRAYEAGGLGRRFNNDRAKPTSANAEIERALPRMRNRHRALVRDNPWAGNAVRAIVTNTVGYGITSEIFEGDQPSARHNAIWQRWAETKACDADGEQNIYGLQQLVMRTVVESGECLVRRRWRRPDDRLEVPFQLQVIEPDYLDHSMDRNLPGGARIVQGIEFDVIGRRAAYWLFRDHPGDNLLRSYQSSRVPASDVIHVFRKDRPQQARGVPWGAAAMISLYDLDGFEDAFLFRQKLANCYMAFEQDEDFGVGELEPVAGDDSRIEELEPGIIAKIPSGRKMTFSSPPTAAGYGEYPMDVLYRVAAAYGVSFQSLTGNLKQVNFSSGRMGWLAEHRNIETWRWNMLIPQFCDGAFGWFVEARSLREPMPATLRMVHTPPRREMMDPTREVPPMISAIRAGITTLPQVHREYGEHTATVLAEIAATNKRLDELEITLDTDPRKVSRAGLTQARAPGSELPDSGSETEED